MCHVGPIEILAPALNNFTIPINHVEHCCLPEVRFEALQYAFGRLDEFISISEFDAAQLPLQFTENGEICRCEIGTVRRLRQNREAELFDVRCSRMRRVRARIILVQSNALSDDSSPRVVLDLQVHGSRPLLVAHNNQSSHLVFQLVEKLTVVRAVDVHVARRFRLR